MDNETLTKLTRIETLLDGNKEDIEEIKDDIKGLKDCYPSKESFNNLDKRVLKIEGNLSKIAWFVIMAVLGAIVSLVIKQ